MKKVLYVTVIYTTYIENSLKSKHLSTSTLLLFINDEIHVIPPVYAEENQQNTKYKKKKKKKKKKKTVNRQTPCFPIIFLLIDAFLL